MEYMGRSFDSLLHVSCDSAPYAGDGASSESTLCDKHCVLVYSYPRDSWRQQVPGPLCQDYSKIGKTRIGHPLSIKIINTNKESIFKQTIDWSNGSLQSRIWPHYSKLFRKLPLV